MMCECNYWAVQAPNHYYHHQPQPQLDLKPYPAYYGYGGYNSVSSSRQQRNQAEKQRRDKLNQFINELALLVPMVATSAKKLDKTSILRLSATFLRIHQILVGVQKGEKMKIPVEWCQQLLDGMEGMLLVVTSSGKIVFLSYNVENILGHHQNELLGSSLLDYTHPEDRMELEENLKPRHGDDDEFIKIGDYRRPERRSFFLRLKQKAATRSDQPQYELVHVEGHLRIAKQHLGQAKNKTESGIHTNDTVLVALVKPYKERYVMDNSILEATKEEWITRHLIDGTIIFSDHRISYFSGYLSEEVTGSPAFKYMHKDDARWVLIALRQMYINSESHGCSSYRLLSKNGVYIHIRTHGFLEKDEKGEIKSFICINTLMSNEEGQKAIAEMKKMFTPTVTQRSEPGISALADIRTSTNGDPGPSSYDDTVAPLKVEDSKELNLAIELLLSDLPPIGIRHESSHPYRMKANTISKTLPPVEVQSRQVGAKLPNLLGRFNRPTVIRSVSANGDRNKRSQENIEEAEVKRLRGNTSVIVSDTRSRLENYAVDTNFIFSTDLLDASNSSFMQFPDDDALRIPVEVTSAELWETPVSNLEEEVLRRHINLENRIQSQGVQIQEIEEDLETIPLSDSHVYQNRFTDLKTEHRKQQELLKTLQQDHKRQQTKEQITLRGAEQDIGV